MVLPPGPEYVINVAVTATSGTVVVDRMCKIYTGIVPCSKDTFSYEYDCRCRLAGTNIIDSSDRDVENVTGGGARREREGHCDWS